MTEKEKDTLKDDQVTEQSVDVSSEAKAKDDEPKAEAEKAEEPKAEAEEKAEEKPVKKAASPKKTTTAKKSSAAKAEDDKPAAAKTTKTTKTASKKEEVKEEAPKEEKPKAEEAPKEEKPKAAAKKPAAKKTEATEAPAEDEKTTEEKPKAAKNRGEAELGEAKGRSNTAKKATKGSPETGNEDFDWEAFDTDTEEISKDYAKFEEMYSDTLSTIAENEVIDGTVISMNKREVVINIGYKSEGVVSLNEFRYNQELKPGDTVEVYVDSQEDKKGQLVLSHKKARAMRSWDRVNQALEQDEVIKGYIKCRTKGGMIVDVFGIEAFLPGSQIDVKPIRDYDAYVDKTM